MKVRNKAQNEGEKKERKECMNEERTLAVVQIKNDVFK
jgi:hypothetical protein